MDKIEVTQADRNLADDLCRDAGAGHMSTPSEWPALLAAHRTNHTDATPVAEPRTIYVQFSDNGNIRKWAWSEFDLAEKLKVETTPVSDTPFAWAYHYTQKHPGQTKPGAMDIKRDRHNSPIAAGWTETPLYTHPPATDVSALVEVIARDYWNMLRQRGGMPPEDTCPPGREDIHGPIAFALAPFTKGQNDE